MSATGWRFKTACGAAIVSGMLVGSARADQPRSESAAGQPAPVLTGPKVDDRDVPGVARGFGAGDSVARRAASRVPPQVLSSALESLLAPDAPADIRATPEQAEKLRELREEFQRQTRAFQREHREELQELRRAAGEFQRPRTGQRPQRAGEQDPMRDTMMDAARDESPDAVAARERLRRLMDSAPKADDVQIKAWTFLSDRQKEHVESRVNAYREAEEQRRAERYVQERMRNRDAEAPAAPAPRQPAVSPQVRPGQRPALSPERRDRLLRIFSSLTPEQQDQLLSRLEARMEEEGMVAARPRARRGNAEGADKPAPRIEDVRVPKEDDVMNSGGDR